MALCSHFGRDDLVCNRTDRDDGSELPDDQCWVLLAKDEADQEAGGFLHLRVDLLSLHAADDRGALPSLAVGVDGDEPVSLAGLLTRVHGWDDPPGRDDIWPVLDCSTDSILLTIPCSNSTRIDTVAIRTGDRGRPLDEEAADPAGTDTVKVDPSARVGHCPVALMIVQFAIQGFNDLFRRPVAVYDPPRTFGEITWQDEEGRFSSRPGRAETGDPDGYVFAVRAQAAYQVKTQWAINGGLATLLRALPAEQLELLRRQVQEGLVSVSNAGFGAHRPGYYSRETNLRELRWGVAVLEGFFGPGSYDGTYYPDQRLYLAAPGEVDAYRELVDGGELRYLVLDRSTVAVEDPEAPGVQRCVFGGAEVRDRGNHLWTERSTGLRLLLIEDRFRDQLMAASDEEVRRGQIALELRRLFLRAVRRPADGPRKLFVYGDDLDHSCGDGWFDGLRIDFVGSYLAGLRWMHAHPWVWPTTVSDPDFEAAQFLHPEPMTVSSSICPSVDPGGAETRDRHGRWIHFDQWYDEWRSTWSPWLGLDLGTLSDSLERALIAWPEAYRNGLSSLAWMYFLACTHESMWSKQPVEGNPNDDPRTWEPEDFVVSASLQQRHAWVYLNASIWAATEVADELAAQGARTWAIARSVPVQERGVLGPRVRQTRSADPYWWQASAASDEAESGCYWDQDLLDTVTLYNRDALLVIDRNGGRITHLFLRTERGAVSVSGTFKCHQFLTFGLGAAVACDGERLQNTVLTPNHAYVAGDLHQAAPRLGIFVDPRAPGTHQPAWYPDNFATYECEVHSGPEPSVTCSFTSEGCEPPPVDPEAFGAACERDRVAKQQGRRGVVCFDGASPVRFRKEIRLRGSTVEVSYQGVDPGHTVTNELCLDLAAVIVDGRRQQVSGGPESVMVQRGPVSVTVTPGAGCNLHPAAWLTSMPADSGPDLARRQQEYGEVHRVLTDDVRMVCGEGGSFDYRIEMRAASAG